MQLRVDLSCALVLKLQVKGLTLMLEALSMVIFALLFSKLG